VRNIDALFFMLEWARCSFHKKCNGTRYTKLVFLHLVGSVGNVGHSGASGARNINAIFFILGWAQCGFHKKRIGIRYPKPVLFFRWDLRAFWCLQVALCRTCVFASSWICGSCSAFLSVRGVKHRCTISHAQRAW
jgi:hypothetical protein